MNKKFLCLILALAMLLSLVACGGNNNDTPSTTDQDPAPTDTTEPTTTPSEGTVGEFQPTTFDYDTLYASAFAGFEDALNAAKDSGNTVDERLAMMAYAEAKLLEGGAIMPYNTQGGNYAISRGVGRTISSVQWGSDSDRLEHAFAVTEFMKSEDSRALKELWLECIGTGTYLEKAKEFLAERGYEIADYYNTTYSSDPTTWDVLSTFNSTNSEWT